jgi:protein-tyrosine phosphatase
LDGELLTSIQRINLRQQSIAKKDQQICRVARGLYIGGISAAKNYNALIHHGITHILNATCVVPNFFNNSSPFQYFTIPLYDDPEADLLAAYTMAAPFINQARRTTTDDNTTGGAVLVHCFAGQSRSAALIIAHLMCEENMSLEEAYVTVKMARNSIKPNSGFLGQLKELEKGRNSSGRWRGVKEDAEEEKDSSLSSSLSSSFTTTTSSGSSVVDAFSSVLVEEQSLSSV